MFVVPDLLNVSPFFVVPDLLNVSPFQSLFLEIVSIETSMLVLSYLF